MGHATFSSTKALESADAYLSTSSPLFSPINDSAALLPNRGTMKKSNPKIVVLL
jgi:hypothetical protein